MRRSEMTVRHLIELLIKFPMDGEITGENGEEIRAIQFTDARESDDVELVFKKKKKDKKKE